MAILMKASIATKAVIAAVIAAAAVIATAAPDQIQILTNQMATLGDISTIRDKTLTIT
jgi:hypothetical protein